MSKSNKSHINFLGGIICTLLFIILLIFIIIITNPEYGVNKVINSCILFVLLIVFLALDCLFLYWAILNWSNYYLERKKYKNSIKNEYNFDYTNELKIHSIYGLEKYNKKLMGDKAKNPPKGIKYYRNYTEWKEHIKEQIDKQILDIENNKDKYDLNISKCINFKRYLKEYIRIQEVYIDGIKTVLIPIELGLITCFIDNPPTAPLATNATEVSFVSTPIVKLMTCIILSITLLVIILYNIQKAEDEKNFLIDTGEIVDDTIKEIKDHRTLKSKILGSGTVNIPPDK